MPRQRATHTLAVFFYGLYARHKPTGACSLICRTAADRQTSPARHGRGRCRQAVLRSFVSRRVGSPGGSGAPCVCSFSFRLALTPCCIKRRASGPGKSGAFAPDSADNSLELSSVAAGRLYAWPGPFGPVICLPPTHNPEPRRWRCSRCCCSGCRPLSRCARCWRWKRSGCAATNWRRMIYSARPVSSAAPAHLRARAVPICFRICSIVSESTARPSASRMTAPGFSVASPQATEGGNSWN